MKGPICRSQKQSGQTVSYIEPPAYTDDKPVCGKKRSLFIRLLTTLQEGNLRHLANIKINHLSQQQIPVKVPCKDGTCMKTPCTKLFFGFQIFFCAFEKIKLIFSTYFKSAYSFVEIIYPSYIYQQKNSDRSVMRDLALYTSTAAVRLF